MAEKEQELGKKAEEQGVPNGERRFSLEELRKAFEDAKKGEIVDVPVVIDQYGSINIEQHFQANRYPTFEDWYKEHYG